MIYSFYNNYLKSKHINAITLYLVSSYFEEFATIALFELLFDFVQVNHNCCMPWATPLQETYGDSGIEQRPNEGRAASVMV